MTPTFEGTVRIGYVRALLDYLTHHGFDIGQVAGSDLLTELEASSLNQRLSLRHWIDLLNRAITVTADPDLPLRVAEELTPRHWGVFAYAAMTCETLAQVVTVLERYERLIDEANDSRLVLEDGCAALQWLPRIERPAPALMQLSVTSWVVFARRYTGRTDLPADVDFTFAAPTDTSTYQRLFGGRIRFGQPVTQLHVPLEYLALPITHHDADTHRLLLSQAQCQIAALDAERSVATQARQAIIRHLSSGTVTLERLAEVLQMAPRTLQYQLEQDGTHFRQLLDEVRRELACAYLADPDMALVDVAFLLGYAEQSPFNKAFKRWTGETPGEYRRRLRS